jgi:hypothetical protein
VRNPKLSELPAAVNSAKVVEVNTTLVVEEAVSVSNQHSATLISRAKLAKGKSKEPTTKTREQG